MEVVNVKNKEIKFNSNFIIIQNEVNQEPIQFSILDPNKIHNYASLNYYILFYRDSTDTGRISLSKQINNGVLYLTLTTTKELSLNNKKTKLQIIGVDNIDSYTIRWSSLPTEILILEDIKHDSINTIESDFISNWLSENQ